MEFDYSKYYTTSAGAHTDAAQREAARYMRQLAPYLPPNKQARILEIGSGNGLILERLVTEGYTAVCGYEADAQLAEMLRKRNLPVEPIAAGDTVSSLSAQKDVYDLVFCMHVIEHVAKDLQLSFVKAVKESLRPGGYFICETPNALSPTANYWRYQDWTHTSCFTPTSLAFLYEANGLQVAYCGAAREGMPPTRNNPVLAVVMRLAEIVLKCISRSISRIHYLAEFGLAGFQFPLSRSLLIIGKKL